MVDSFQVYLPFNSTLHFFGTRVEFPGDVFQGIRLEIVVSQAGVGLVGKVELISFRLIYMTMMPSKHWGFLLD